MKPLDIDPSILEQAADWLVQMHSGEGNAVNDAEIERWRSQSEQHEVAWQRAQQFIGIVHTLPPELGKAALQRPVSPARRRAIKKLAVLLALSPAAWQAWRTQPWLGYTSDYHVATGRQQHIKLADGTALVLNTATSIDVIYDQHQRLVRLKRGELHITTATDPSGRNRPFRVQTRDGMARALGTRFSIRQLDHSSHLAVFDSAVEITPKSSPNRKTIIQAGSQTEFGAMDVQQPRPVSEAQEAWTHGMLVVRDQPLAAVVDELRRYHVGVLRCHPDIGRLRVSGTFPLTEIGRTLNLLQRTLPISVARVSPYWINLSPAS
ncbi:FecR domain-containing protein [Methylobacillus flagellatus]|uniref:Putative FecR n=1 Tax=Methylobacillus flagellatus (strain ATCC 51484 / DSM 6875 / VKM B-1610 / KT) TaxID=265072 RepID=Q1GXU4_METFK|nr:FecR domain-containing protein [Methylobacillus flagellatus]ABE50943.1 putative FecR [Methylobacillus flagellatus KT]